MTPRIAIIGAGAAGLMALAALLEESTEAELLLLERNNGLGKKVLISGGGRCNVTSGISSSEELLKRYPRGAHFLKPSLSQFPPSAVVAWFEAHGVPLKTEADLRVFPESDNGADIVGVFEHLFQDPSCSVLLSKSVTGIERIPNGFRILLKEREPLEVTHLILTTGGQAYRHTGSTGDGYAFAESLGHHITPLAPSLNGFILKETWPRTLSGVSWKDAILRMTAEPTQHARGPFLFTHQGVSGPAVFALSSLIAFSAYDAAHPLSCTIDLFPDHTIDTLMKEIQLFISQHPKKAFSSLLDAFVPRSLGEALTHAFDFPRAGHICEYPKTLHRELATLLKGLPLTITGRTPGDEFVTAGGVDTTEVNSHTMESLICPNLYFAGELLNIDGFTGGFNLQASWATGRAAGAHLAHALRTAS